MTTASVSKATSGSVVNSVPDGEVHIIVSVHGERGIESGKNGSRITKVHTGKTSRTNGVNGANREKGSADAVSADIEEVNGEVRFINPVVSERIPGKLCGGFVVPIDSGGTLDGLGKNTANIASGLLELLG